jgi:sec-independent protein translocase protein TatA
MTLANLFGALDGPDLLIILVIVLLLFGGAKLPQLARSLGEAKREFHRATVDDEPVVPDQPSTASSPGPDMHNNADPPAGKPDSVS